jgi:hypothetical protein
MSLLLIVVAAKETCPQFANVLCIHHRQGSSGAPSGDERDPGLSRSTAVTDLGLKLAFCSFLKKGAPISTLPCASQGLPILSEPSRKREIPSTRHGVLI